MALAQQPHVFGFKVLSMGRDVWWQNDGKLIAVNGLRWWILPAKRGRVDSTYYCIVLSYNVK